MEERSVASNPRGEVDMSLLIAVKSCNKHRVAGYNEVIRQTWGRDVKFPSNLFFFHGGIRLDNDVRLDEVFVGEPDNYDGLPKKTRAILRWFLRGPEPHIFLCDTDTYVIPSKLEKCGYENYDIAGRYGTIWPIGTTKDITDDRGVARRNVHPWPSGGVGYFLSRRAAQIVLDTPINTWAEDYHSGQATGPHIQSGELKAIDLPNFECEVSWHFPRRIYKQVYDLKFNWQAKMYAEHR